MHRETKKAPGVPGLSGVEPRKESRDQGALDAPILSQSTNRARRGSRKRPDPPLSRTTGRGWARPRSAQSEPCPRELYPKSDHRRPNSDVLARERDGVGLVACRAPLPSLAPSPGGAFSSRFGAFEEPPRMSSERDICLRRADEAKRRATQATEPSIKSAYEKVAEHWVLLARLESRVAAEKNSEDA